MVIIALPALVVAAVAATKCYSVVTLTSTTYSCALAGLIDISSTDACAAAIGANNNDFPRTLPSSLARVTEMSGSWRPHGCFTRSARESCPAHWPAPG